MTWRAVSSRLVMCRSVLPRGVWRSSLTIACRLDGNVAPATPHAAVREGTADRNQPFFVLTHPGGRVTVSHDG